MRFVSRVVLSIYGMAPPLLGKRKGELYLECCLRNDIEAALLVFLNGVDISFSQFKLSWRNSQLGLLLHACAKEHVDQSVYIQIVFHVILSLLNCPAVPVTSTDVPQHRLLQLQDGTDRNVVWNIGIVYCLYVMYHTQDCISPKQLTSVGTHMHPINIGPDTALKFMKAAEQFINLGPLGAAGIEIYKNLWTSGAFRCCAYSGPSSMYFSQRTSEASAEAPVKRRKTVVSSNVAATPATTTASASSITTAGTSVNGLTAGTISSSSSSNGLNHRMERISQYYCIPETSALVTAPSVALAATTPTTVTEPVPATTVAAIPAMTADCVLAITTSTNIDQGSVGSETSSSAVQVETVVLPQEERSPLLTELLAQSIPERRQNRADKLQQRKNQEQEKENARRAKLKKKFMKHLEVVVPDESAPARAKRGAHATDTRTQASQETTVNAGGATSTASSPTQAASTRTSRSAPKRTYVLQSELPTEAIQRVQTASLLAVPGASKLSLDTTFPARMPAPRLEPARRTRGASAADREQLPPQPSRPSTTRRAAGAATANDANDDHDSDNDNADLVDSFEEFVGLRAPAAKPPSAPRVTRAATSAAKTTTTSAASAEDTGRRRNVATSSGAGTSKSSTRSAPPLDAETGDIMDILRQLEADSAAVLGRGVAGRTRGSSQQGVQSACTTSVAPQLETAGRSAQTGGPIPPSSKRTRGVGAAPQAAAVPVPPQPRRISDLTLTASAKPSTKRAGAKNPKKVSSTGSATRGRGRARSADSSSASGTDNSEEDAPVVLTAKADKHVSAASAAKVARKSTPAGRPVDASATAGTNTGSADINIMDMLLRLEQESQEILHGGLATASAVDDNRPAVGSKRANSADGSGAATGRGAKATKTRKQNQPPSATASSAAASAPPAISATTTASAATAAAKRTRVSAAGVAAVAEDVVSATGNRQTSASSSAPAPSSRAHRATGAPATAAPAATVAQGDPSADASDDIMALLGRLEQESNQVLGAQNTTGQGSSAEPGLVVAPAQARPSRRNRSAAAEIDSAGSIPAGTNAAIVDTGVASNAKSAAKGKARSARQASSPDVHAATTATAPTTANITSSSASSAGTKNAAMPSSRSNSTPAVLTTTATTSKRVAAKPPVSSKRQRKEGASAPMPTAASSALLVSVSVELAQGAVSSESVPAIADSAAVSGANESADSEEIMALLAQLEQQSSVILSTQ